MKRILPFLFCLFLAACSTWPHDPRGTTETVRGGVMVVGVSENPPWVTRDGDTPGGVEVDLVRQFAAEMDAEIDWQWGSLSEHLAALHQFELHLAIGGLTQSSPGSGEAGLTQPYYETDVVVGLPPGVPAPARLDDTPIGVVRGTAVADYVRQAGADPLLLADPAQIDLPTAVPAWQLDDLRLSPTPFTLHTLRHVMAVPPGENRWLVELEGFLQRQPPLDLK